MTTNNSQGIYAPLPQNLSDSDSDKDMHDPSIPQFTDRPILNGVPTKIDSNAIYHNGYDIPNHLIEKPKPKEGFSAMSQIRKMYFSLSVALCFLTIVAFLWVLPCSQGTCPVKISNWDQVYESFELKGKINIVQGFHGLNLLVMYRGNINTSGGGGIISVNGNNGGFAWHYPQIHQPEQVDCDLIDVNGDGILDCLLLGDDGIEAIEPMLGKSIWHVHADYETKPIKNIGFPIVVPDLNGDGINDLIMRLTNAENKCIVVSGRTGKVLYEFVLTGCQSIQGITYYDKDFVYICNNKTDHYYFRIAVNDLRMRIYNRNLAIIPIKVGYSGPQCDVYRLSHYQLIIDNNFDCPDCKANMTLVDEKTDKVVWSYFHSSTRVMLPTSFSFKPSKNNLLSLKGHINGFIIKLWQWVDVKSSIKVHKRFLPQTNNTVSTNTIIERVVLITFNATDIHVTNSSSTEITQICLSSENEFVCQPDMNNQDQSVTIADLDGDGSQELISFSSSFDMRNNLQLASNIKVIRLEAELPKLYEVAK